jgi:RimJ/RimL family protein N-acetyltransferase
LAIVETASQTMIGDCGLYHTEAEPRQIKVGITLGSAHQGRGYATEALRCLMDFLFGVLDMHRLFAIVDAENVRSAALFRRLGFRQEAHFIQNTWFKGKWGSEFVFAMLKEEWAKK